MHRNFIRFILLSTAVPLAITTAAQANEVFLGQTGVTNTISIVQSGSDNAVGADETTRLVSQNGLNNALDVTQTGTLNQLGAANPGPPGLSGVLQSGGDNEFTVIQTNLGGQNIIGAVEQVAASGLGIAPTNSLTITQTDALDATATSGLGEGNHFIGDVQQSRSAAAGSANSATLSQFGGGTAGQTLNSLVQTGVGNLALIDQFDTGNVIGSVYQEGESNEATLVQRGGSGNRIEALTQLVAGNLVEITMIGDQNLVLSAVQQNVVTGNNMILSLAGNDNGGNGFGSVGNFQFAVTRGVSATQAKLEQFGDQNSLNYSTDATSEGNLYGFFQDGDGNAASGNTEGAENEVAIVQIGDGNTVDFLQRGNSNALAVEADGDYNRLNVSQSGGNFNTVLVTFTGSSGNNALAGGGFTVPLDVLAGTLAPGDIQQQGGLNAVQIAVVSGGSGNKFATLQTGSQNSVTGSVNGSSNQALVIQSGILNVAYYAQTGNNNKVIIRQ